MKTWKGLKLLFCKGKIDWPSSVVISQTDSNRSRLDWTGWSALTSVTTSQPNHAGLKTKYVFMRCDTLSQKWDPQSKCFFGYLVEQKNMAQRKCWKINEILKKKSKCLNQQVQFFSFFFFFTYQNNLIRERKKHMGQYIILKDGILWFNSCNITSKQGVYFNVHSLGSIQTNCQWD